MFRMMRMVGVALLKAGLALIVGSRRFWFPRSLAGDAAQQSRCQHQRPSCKRQRRRGQDSIHIDSPNPLRCWYRSSTSIATETTVRCSRRAAQKQTERKEAKLLSAPPEKVVHKSHTDWIKKSVLVVKDKARVEAANEAVQKAVEEQRFSRNSTKRRRTHA